MHNFSFMGHARKCSSLTNLSRMIQMQLFRPMCKLQRKFMLWKHLHICNSDDFYPPSFGWMTLLTKCTTNWWKIWWSVLGFVCSNQVLSRLLSFRLQKHQCIGRYGIASKYYYFKARFQSPSLEDSWQRNCNTPGWFSYFKQFCLEIIQSLIPTSSCLSQIFLILFLLMC